MQLCYLRGAYNRTYSSAARQPEKDLPRQPSAVEVGLLMFEVPMLEWMGQTSAIAIAIAIICTIICSLILVYVS